MFRASVFQSALNSAGPQAANIERLWWLFFWITTGVFVITMAFVALAVIRGKSRIRLKPDPTPARGVGLEADASSAAGLEPDIRANLIDPKPFEPALNVAVTLAVGSTVIILFVLLIATFFTGRA